MKCLARAVGPKIRVNSVSPGILLTVRYPVLLPLSCEYNSELNMSQDWGRQFSKEHLQAAKDATLLKRFAAVEVSSP